MQNPEGDGMLLETCRAGRGKARSPARGRAAPERCGRALARGIAVAVLAGCGARTGLIAGDANVEADDASVALDSTVADARDESMADASVARDAGLADAAIRDGGAGDAPLEAEASCSLDAGVTPEAGCNAFAATCRTVVPPAEFGPLFFALESSGCGCPSGGAAAHARACANSLILLPLLTIEQKCTTLVAAINAMCGPAADSADFQADGTHCDSGTFTVTDLTCEGRASAGTGVTLLLSSTQSTVPPGQTVVDSEQDLVTSGCQAQGSALAILTGSPTGTGIQTAPASVVFVVSTPDQGIVNETVLTSPTMTASDIVALAVAKANLSLAASQSRVRCAQDPVVLDVATCTLGASGDGGAPLGVPVTFQVNDIGLQRAIMAGPAADILRAEQAIDDAGGLPNVIAFNFVGGPTCSPCDGGAGVTVCCR
jgi:hypothetical protein